MNPTLLRPDLLLFMPDCALLIDVPFLIYETVYANSKLLDCEDYIKTRASRNHLAFHETPTCTFHASFITVFTLQVSYKVYYFSLKLSTTDFSLARSRSFVCICVACYHVLPSTQLKEERRACFLHQTSKAVRKQTPPPMYQRRRVRRP